MRGRRKRFAKERERSKGEEREPRWMLGGRMVVVLASCRGAGGERVSGSVVRRLEQRGERGTEMTENWGKWLVFHQLWTRFSSFSGHEIHPYL